ncbi:unknown protein [Seminavis robusta]|uniref:Uncharacterized protein n=1 Tax=Seminavis robusta TaxID=568900 RepID=A0A9N8DBF9_9STRA|nr:unknown protein [Seminavis robusta]|eukprot:Sro75_g041440.1 n/a (335) ;mRNA; r:125514-126518
MSMSSFIIYLTTLLFTEQVDRVRTNFNQLKPNFEGNPVEKIPLKVLRVNKSVDIVEAPTGEAAIPGEAAEGQGQVSVSREDLNHVLSHVQRLEQTVEQQFTALRAEQTSLRAWQQQQFDRVVLNQRRFGGSIESALGRQDPTRRRQRSEHAEAEARQRQPPRQRARLQEEGKEEGKEEEAAPPPPPPRPPRAEPTRAATRGDVSQYAKLCPNVKSLTEMWQEYQFGIGTNKAAKDFTNNEVNGQGKPFKQKYSRRNKIWRIQQYMVVNCRYTIDAANAKIIEVYGHSSVTNLIGQITRDQKNPTLPYIGSQRMRRAILPMRNGPLGAGLGGILL